MPGIVTWRRDVAEEVKKRYRSTVLPNLRGYVVELELNEEILDLLERDKDQVTAMRMVEDAQQACTATVTTLVGHLKQLDTDCQGKAQAEINRLVAAFEGTLKAELARLGKTVESLPKARWDALVATRKQYREYRWDCAGKVTLGVLGGIGAGLAIAAAAPTGGASLGLAIVSGVRSGQTLVKTAHLLWREAEDVEKSVFKDLQTLKEKYVARKKSAGVNELKGTVINTVLGMDVKASVPVVDKNVTLWRNKLAGLDVKGHELGKEFMTALEASQKLEAQLRVSKSKDAGRILDKLTRLRTTLKPLFDKAAAMNARVTKAAEGPAVAAKIVTELKAQVPRYAEVFDKLFPALVNLSLAGANAGVGFREAKDALETANTALGLANDLMSTLNEAME